MRGAGRSGSGTPKNSNITGSTSRKPSSSSSSRPAMLLAHGAVVVALVDAVVGAEYLEDRQQRQVLAVRHGVRLRSPPVPLRAAALGELEAEPALAGAGLGRRCRRTWPWPACACASASSSVRHVRVAARRSGLRPRARETSKRVRAAPSAAQLDTRARAPATPFTCEGAEIVELEVAGDQRAPWRRSGSRCLGSASASMRCARPTVWPCAV